jgi:hypothetical protein
MDTKQNQHLQFQQLAAWTVTSKGHMALELLGGWASECACCLQSWTTGGQESVVVSVIGVDMVMEHSYTIWGQTREVMQRWCCFSLAVVCSEVFSLLQLG